MISASVQPLFFREFGRGPALVLLHGLGVSGEMFQPVWDQLAARHHLIVPDLRGMGRSAHLPGPYSVERLASDVANLIENLHISSVTVVGVSQGGAVAQQIASRHPAQVERLVLVSTFACNLTTLRERFEARLLPLLLQMLGPARVARLIVRSSSFGGAPISPDQLYLLRRLLSANTTNKMLSAHAAMADFDSRPWLSHITQPTLILCGSKDRAVPCFHARVLAQGIRRAQLHEVEGAGHALIYTHTEQFINILESWLH